MDVDVASRSFELFVRPVLSRWSKRSEPFPISEGVGRYGPDSLTTSEAGLGLPHRIFAVKCSGMAFVSFRVERMGFLPVSSLLHIPNR